MTREAWLRVDRADEVFRQEDRCNEMKAITMIMCKLVKKGSKVHQAESDRVIKMVHWA